MLKKRNSLQICTLHCTNFQWHKNIRSFVSFEVSVASPERMGTLLLKTTFASCQSHQQLLRSQDEKFEGTYI